MDWPLYKLQVCNLIFDKFAQAEQQKVNKHPRFDANFNIQCQLEHFGYDMNRTLVVTLEVQEDQKMIWLTQQKKT